VESLAEMGIWEDSEFREKWEQVHCRFLQANLQEGK
jgi:hypothetical protein